MDSISMLAIAVMLASLALGALRRVSLTLALIVANFLVFFLEIFGPGYVIESQLGFRPEYLQTGDDLYTLFTSMFVHASAMHLLANMLFLLFFGWPLEERIGKARMLVVYLAAGILGAVFEGMVRWGEYTVIIGASGAIAGLVGALFILYPREKLTLPLFIIILPNVPVWAAALVFFGVQLFLALGVAGTGVAVTAHLAGFVVGMAVGWNLPRASKRSQVSRLDAQGLRELATTPELKESLAKIEGETHEDVRRAWLEHFASRARCPRCGSSLTLKGDSLSSECGYEVRLR
ncbi:MAG: rhomboid family intramembrane serine protease [Methanomassiliicoccales archaeon]|jgi:membrane associated rhomboid family serine protease|nr:rhomboid family intramembrane serine protease [Methanomassiliicoccales archaeon]